MNGVDFALACLTDDQRKWLSKSVHARRYDRTIAMPSVLTRNELLADVASSFPDNTTGKITPAILRSQQINVVDSARIGGSQVTVNGGAYSVTGDESFIFAKNSPTITFPAANDAAGPFPSVAIRTLSGETTLAVAGGTIEVTSIPFGAAVVMAPDAIDNGWFFLT